LPRWTFLALGKRIRPRPAGGTYWRTPSPVITVVLLYTHES